MEFVTSLGYTDHVSTKTKEPKTTKLPSPREREREKWRIEDKRIQDIAQFIKYLALKA